MFTLTRWQIHELAEEIIAANTSPLFSGDDEYLVIGFPFIYKKLIAKAHERKYDALHFLVLICRDPTTNEWVIIDYARGFGDCRHLEVEVEPLMEDTRNIFFREDQ